MEGWVASHALVWLRQRRAPLLLGPLVFGLGGVLDLVYHVAPTKEVPWLFAWLGPDGEVAHLMTFAGMVFVVASLVFSGVRR